MKLLCIDHRRAGPLDSIKCLIILQIDIDIISIDIDILSIDIDILWKDIDVLLADLATPTLSRPEQAS